MTREEAIEAARSHSAWLRQRAAMTGNNRYEPAHTFAEIADTLDALALPIPESGEPKPAAWRFQKEPLSDDPYELCDDADEAGTYIGPLYTDNALAAAKAQGAAEAREKVVEWRFDVENAPRHSEPLQVLVRTSDTDEGCGGHLENAIVGRSIGFCNDEGEWQFAGWDWCNDIHLEGSGTVVAWAPMLPLPSADAIENGEAS